MTVISFTRPLILINGRKADGRQRFDRYTQIVVAATFYDYSGNVVTPASATAMFSYRAVADGCLSSQTYDMTASGNVWSYTWDSSVAQRGPVSVHVESATPLYAADCTFRLTTGLANRIKAGDDEDFHYV